MTEAQLIAAAKTGERAAFDVLCQTHTDRLFRTVSRITRNHHDAQDAVQDSLLSIFLHLRGFDGRSSFSTWATRIAINTALMTLRRKQRCREVSLDNDDDTIRQRTSTTDDPEKQFAERERLQLIRDEVARLRVSLRRPLELCELEDYSHKDTAKMTGISIPAAKGRLFHARRSLRKSKVLCDQFRELKVLGRPRPPSRPARRRASPSRRTTACRV